MTTRDELQKLAEVAGVKWLAILDEGVLFGESHMECDFWNPETNLSDRYELIRKAGLLIDFRDGIVDLHGSVDYWKFTPGDDASEWEAIKSACLQAWEERKK